MAKIDMIIFATIFLIGWAHAALEEDPFDGITCKDLHDLQPRDNQEEDDSGTLTPISNEEGHDGDEGSGENVQIDMEEPEDVEEVNADPAPAPPQEPGFFQRMMICFRSLPVQTRAIIVSCIVYVMWHVALLLIIIFGNFGEDNNGTERPVVVRIRGNACVMKKNQE